MVGVNFPTDEESQIQGVLVTWLRVTHLKIGVIRFIETESRMVVAKGWGTGKWEIAVQ